MPVLPLLLCPFQVLVLLQDIAMWSRFPREKEYLFPSNSRFQVIKNLGLVQRLHVALRFWHRSGLEIFAGLGMRWFIFLLEVVNC